MNARSFRLMTGMQPERRTGGPNLATARLLLHDSSQLSGASQFIKPNDVEPVDRLDPPPALGTPMPAIRHGANFHAPRAKPDGSQTGSIVHAGRGAFHADHVCTLPKGCFSSSSRRLESTVRKHSLPGACSLWPSAHHDGVRQRSALHPWPSEQSVRAWRTSHGVFGRTSDVSQKQRRWLTMPTTKPLPSLRSRP